MKTVTRRANNRSRVLLDSASSLFAAGGYASTSIRDIATASGMLPGSVYYHYPSKADLLMAVYERGVTKICHRHDEVTAKCSDPWEKLEAALANHILTVTEKSDEVSVMNRVLPDQVPERSKELIKLRDCYEQRIRTLVENLPLPGGIDRGILRLMIIGATSWTQNWFRPGKTRPADIAAQYCAFLKLPLKVAVSPGPDDG
jgi:AcrR family transcriptional regulator